MMQIRPGKHRASNDLGSSPQRAYVVQVTPPRKSLRDVEGDCLNWAYEMSQAGGASEAQAAIQKYGQQTSDAMVDAVDITRGLTEAVIQEERRLYEEGLRYFDEFWEDFDLPESNPSSTEAEWEIVQDVSDIPSTSSQTPLLPLKRVAFKCMRCR